MLLNLGMTADAAAAHNSNDITGSQSEIQHSPPTRHSNSLPFSFAALPSWGLGNLANKGKGPDTTKSTYLHRRSMPVSRPVEPSSSSDEDKYPTPGPSPVRSRIAQQQSVKQSSRPRTSYQLAHPATNARHKRLKLRPKLLLQLQQVSSTPRPVPILDVLPSTLFMPRLARKFPTIMRGKKGLGPNDLIVTTSDLYERSVGDTTDKSISSDDENGEHREVVATICQIFKEDAMAKGKAEICLDCGPVWEATPLPNGSYEFAANTDSEVMILRWVRRGTKKRRSSAPPGTIQQEDSRRFTFSVIGPNTRRHPVIASMTRNQLEVFDRYSIPTASGLPGSPTSAMSVISDASDMDAPLDRPSIQTDDNLRMLIIVTAIWVAFREGWSPNFRYNDSALTSKAMRSPTSKAGRVEKDRALDETGSKVTEQSEAEPKRRVATWGTLSSQHISTSEQSLKYGSLSKRSNSTGAAFIERTNRRASAVGSRPNRHSMLTSPREVEHATTTSSSSSGQSPGCCRTWPQHRKSHAERPAKSTSSPDNQVRLSQPQEAQIRAKRQPKISHQSVNTQPENSGPAKGKRRHRFSSLFDFIVRRNGNHHE